MNNQETVNVDIEISKKLLDLIADMAKNVNDQFKTDYTAKSLIGKYVTQYFGTKNQLDIMAFSTQRFKEQTGDMEKDIMELYNTFQEMAVKLDEVSMRTGNLFLEVIKRLEKADQTQNAPAENPGDDGKNDSGE